MSPVVRRTWHGDEIEARANRANGRAIISMGERTAAAMQSVAHVVSGDLKRTIHTARPDTLGVIGADEETVRTGTHDWQLEVGSWLPYACVENNRGGAHRFADIGWEMTRDTFNEALVAAWREEGL